MTYTNPLNYSNISSWTDILNAPNVVTGSWFYTTIIYMIFIISMAALSITAGFESAFLISAVVLLLPAILMAYAGLVGWWVVGTFVGAILFMIIYSYWGNKKDY